MECLMRKRKQPNNTVARFEEHCFMESKCLPQTLMPALSLATQRLGADGHLGPAHRIRGKQELPIQVLLPRKTLHAHDKFHILFRSFSAVTTRCNTGCLLEKAKSTRNNQESINPAPAGAAGEEAAKIFDHLDDDPKVKKQVRLAYAARVNNRSVHSSDNAPYCHNPPGIVKNSAQGVGQRLALKERVSVHGQEIRVLGEVDARI